MYWENNMVEEVCTLGEYINVIGIIEQNLISNGMDKNEKMLFRGQSDMNYKLIPSIARERETPIDISIFNEERNLIEMAKFQYPDVFKNTLLPIELLALLQHYGIPTRLMDVTESALVALYFACCSNGTKDGEVIVFKENRLDIANYPIVNAISESYKYARSTFCELSMFYDSVVNQPYFVEQKDKIKTKEDAAKWIKMCCDELLFVYSSNLSLRQKIQRGRYILFPNEVSESVICFEGEEKTNYIFKSIIKPIDKEDEEVIIGRIIIKSDYKEKIMKELSIMGITRGYLFGDSVDIGCEEIKNSWLKKISGEK